MKVLMIEHYLPGSVYSLELSNQLYKYVNLTLITSRNFKENVSGFRCKKILETNVKKSKFGVLRYLFGTVLTIVNGAFGGYDIIHVQTFKMMNFEMFIYIFFKKVLRKSIVYTAHNILPHEWSDCSVKLKKWYRLCDGIIVHNQQSKKILLEFIPNIETEIFVVQHGTYSIYEESVDKINHEKFVFLQFGMIRKYKGIDILLNAIAKLSEEYRYKCEFIIVGKQYKELDDTDYEGMAIDLGIEKSTKFVLSHIPDDIVPKYFNMCDCCLFPYTNIYGSGALLMAYTFKTPVIASSIPVFIEETGDGSTGILFESGNADSLALAIEKFITMQNGKKQSYITNIELLCKEKYCWENSAQKILTVYKECQ